jgi:hypothetical protein
MNKYEKKGDYFAQNSCQCSSTRSLYIKLGMSAHVFNLPVSLKEKLHPVWVSLVFDTTSYIFKEYFQVHVPLILDDYVV